MEKTMSVWFVCGFFVTSLLFSKSIADGKIKEVTDPTGNVNLSPFQQWRNAYECLQNKSDSCPGNLMLNETGWVNISMDETQQYCSGGCEVHTRAVLTCISLVKPDYRFFNNATVQDINNTITTGCTSGFSGATLIASDATRKSKSWIKFCVSLAPVLFVMNHLYV
ncbi:hypothetical protein ACFE04_018984 [Oxalis oulophora]